MFFLSVFFGIILYCSYSRSAEEVYSTIPQSRSYIYHENEKMSFEVYCNDPEPYASYLDLNQYSLTYESGTYTLQNVSCEVLQQGEMYLLILYSDMIRPVDSLFHENVVLRIVNSKYKLSLNIGSLAILDPYEYSLLNVDSLYASYGYINKELYLVGINIVFHDSFQTLKNFRVGVEAFGCLDTSLKDVQASNEINIIDLVPRYTIPMKKSDSMEMAGKMYFIPIGYDSLSLIRQGYITMILDGQRYYLQTFNFILSELDYRDYSSLEEGEIVYATI